MSLNITLSGIFRCCFQLQGSDLSVNSEVHSQDPKAAPTPQLSPFSSLRCRICTRKIRQTTGCLAVLLQSHRELQLQGTDKRRITVPILMIGETMFQVLDVGAKASRCHSDKSKLCGQRLPHPKIISFGIRKCEKLFGGWGA